MYYLQLLSGGDHDVDIDDLRRNTLYTGGYSEGSRTIKIFWEVWTVIWNFWAFTSLLNFLYSVFFIMEDVKRHHYCSDHFIILLLINCIGVFNLLIPRCTHSFNWKFGFDYEALSKEEIIYWSKSSFSLVVFNTLLMQRADLGLHCDWD